MSVSIRPLPNTLPRVGRCHVIGRPDRVRTSRMAPFDAASVAFQWLAQEQQRALLMAP